MTQSKENVKLKTIKDLKYLKERNGGYTPMESVEFAHQVKQEAIKWVKYGKAHGVIEEGFMNFHNITGEDLK